jgi:hypothetical protein
VEFSGTIREHLDQQQHGRHHLDHLRVCVAGFAWSRGPLGWLEARGDKLICRPVHDFGSVFLVSVGSGPDPTLDPRRDRLCPYSIPTLGFQHCAPKSDR